METPTFLYKPNFCAECGEKIERENWHFWSSRRFCENCEPVYRLNRIFPIALTVIVVFFGGMFFGQMGRSGEKANPVISTQAAQTMSITERPSPPQQQKQPSASENSAVNQILPANTPTEPARSASSGNSGDSSAGRQLLQVPVEVYICGARTQKGAPCSRRVKAAGTRCWQHLGKSSMLERPYR